METGSSSSKVRPMRVRFQVREPFEISFFFIFISLNTRVDFPSSLRRRKLFSCFVYQRKGHTREGKVHGRWFRMSLSILIGCRRKERDSFLSLSNRSTPNQIEIRTGYADVKTGRCIQTSYFLRAIDATPISVRTGFEPVRSDVIHIFALPRTSIANQRFRSNGNGSNGWFLMVF